MPGTRRSLLLLGAALSGLAAAGIALWSGRPGGADPRRLLAALADVPSAARIGAVVLARSDQVDDPEAVRARLQALADELAALGTLDDGAALREAIRLRVGDDFLAGTLVEADGWLLARTETDLSVLASLAGGER